MYSSLPLLFLHFYCGKKKIQDAKKEPFALQSQKEMWLQEARWLGVLCMLIPTQGLEGLGANTASQLTLAWRPPQPRLP